jgi:hypothetical protein
VTQTASRWSSQSEATVNPRLIRLLEEDKLDWDNPDHRRAYLETWIRRGGDLLSRFSARKEEH